MSPALHRILVRLGGCVILVSVVAKHASATTLVTLSSDSGDWVGQGVTSTWTPPDGQLTIQSNDGHITITGESPWSFSFYGGSSTLVPGTYEITRHAPGDPVLDVASSRSCASVAGRFSVLEIEYAADQSVTRLAIDFEQHCSTTPSAALFGSIRFDSTIDVGPRFGVSSAVALEGNGEPTALSFWISLSRRLNVDAQVSFAAVDGSAVGGVDYTANTGVAHFPAGTTAVRVDVSILGNAIAQPDRALGFELGAPVEGSLGVATAVGTILDDDGERTYFSIESEPGDWIGRGRSVVLTPLDGALRVSGQGMEVQMSFTGEDESWSLSARSAARQGNLAVGLYDGVEQSAPDDCQPSLKIWGNQRGCDFVAGRFFVHEIEYDQWGTLTRLALDFEQHCDGAAPALFGSLRYHSAFPVRTAVSIAPATGYEGDGLLEALAFTLALPRKSAVPVSVHYATVDGTATAGLDFLATSGEAVIPAGQSTTQVEIPLLGDHVPEPNREFRVALSDPTGASIEIAEAAGTILDDDGVRTVLYLDSEPGDPVAGGKRLLLGSLEGVAGAYNVPDTFVGFSFQNERQYYRFDFSAPTGQTLAVGNYEQAVPLLGGDETRPHIGVSSFDGSCTIATGRFVVRELEAAGPSVGRMAIDFELLCAGASGRLTGSIRWNSSLPITPRVEEAALYTLNPCRIADTRAGSTIAPGATAVFELAGRCGIPNSAKSVSANLTVISADAPGHLTLYGGDRVRPWTSSINFGRHAVRANNVLVELSRDGRGSIRVLSASAAPVDIILDVTGFFE